VEICNSATIETPRTARATDQEFDDEGMREKKEGEKEFSG